MDHSGDPHEVVINEIVIGETLVEMSEGEFRRSASPVRALDLQHLVKRLAAREAVGIGTQSVAPASPPTSTPSTGASLNQNEISLTRPRRPKPSPALTEVAVGVDVLSSGIASSGRGAKSFFCDMCGHEFSCRKNMMRHQVIHSGENPHRCRLCDKGFNRSDALKRHMKTHDIHRLYKPGATEPGAIGDLKNLEEGEVIIRENGRPLICHRMNDGETDDESLYIMEHNPNRGDPNISAAVNGIPRIDVGADDDEDDDEISDTNAEDLIIETIRKAKVQDLAEKGISSEIVEQRVAEEALALRVKRESRAYEEAQRLCEERRRRRESKRRTIAERRKQRLQQQQQRDTADARLQKTKNFRRIVKRNPRESNILNRGFPAELLPSGETGSQAAPSASHSKLSSINILTPRRDSRTRTGENDDFVASQVIMMLDAASDD
ncbi:uncharacterized protein LOC141909841 [Tubulanus polymorphus]|uniref:uncharacterized protein LOC141909841 n=1 Tax=Tubulanus polymorphus TaxID=672921 RepID=UPI003DA4FB2E